MQNEQQTLIKLHLMQTVMVRLLLKLLLKNMVHISQALALSQQLKDIHMMVNGIKKLLAQLSETSQLTQCQIVI